jgi:hypothetical protein
MPVSNSMTPAIRIADDRAATIGPVLCEARAIDFRCVIVRCQLSLFARHFCENGPIRIQTPGGPAALEFCDSLGR